MARKLQFVWSMNPLRTVLALAALAVAPTSMGCLVVGCSERAEPTAGETTARAADAAEPLLHPQGEGVVEENQAASS